MSQNTVSERFICVWLSDRSKVTDECLKTQEALKFSMTYFKIFNDADECIDFISDSAGIKFCLITSDVIGKTILALINDFEQIDTVYIYYSNKSRNSKWTENYKKIKQIFPNVKSICDKISPKPISNHDSSLAISFVSSSDLNSKDINRQDPSFMYFQLIKDILLYDRFQENEYQAKSDMITFCRKTYRASQMNLEVVDEFEQHFHPELSISWYTRESFLFRILNEALWMSKPDVLYQLRYFLRHLHQQILHGSIIQRQNFESSIVVYRGQGMKKQEIEKLQQNVGGFLSFNNFLSTSLNKQVAVNFLWGSNIGVLFQMEIDTNIQKFPFVHVQELPHLKNECSEQEVLFSMGTVFRIHRIEHTDQYYYVYLKLSDDIDQQLDKYTKATREKTQTSHSFLSLLRLMNELAQYNCIDDFVQMVTEDSPLLANSSLIAAIYHMFGSIYNGREQYKNALHYYNKSLEIYLSFLPADDQRLTPTYNNIGSIYLAQSDYERALIYQQFALDCQLNSNQPDLSSIITYTKNIATIYSHQKKYEDALIYLKRVLEYQQQYLSADDPSLIETYHTLSSVYYKQELYEEAALYHEKAVKLQQNIVELDPTSSADNFISSGSLCLSQQQYKDALIHFNRAREIQEKYLLPNHPSLGKTYDRIADIHFKENQFEEALSYYLKVLEIEETSLSQDNTSIGTSQFNISRTLVALLRWSEALEYCLKSLEQFRKSFKTDQITLASVTHYLGYIYFEQEDFEIATHYYEEALRLFNFCGSEYDPSLAPIYHRTGGAYYKIGRYEDAITSYQKELKIQLATLPNDKSEISTTYSNISHAYEALNKLDEASIAAQSAIDQLCRTLPYDHPDVMRKRIQLDALLIKSKH